MLWLGIWFFQIFDPLPRKSGPDPLMYWPLPTYIEWPYFFIPYNRGFKVVISIFPNKQEQDQLWSGIDPLPVTVCTWWPPQGRASPIRSELAGAISSQPSSFWWAFPTLGAFSGPSWSKPRPTSWSCPGKTRWSSNWPRWTSWRGPWRRWGCFCGPTSRWKCPLCGQLFHYLGSFSQWRPLHHPQFGLLWLSLGPCSWSCHKMGGCTCWTLLNLLQKSGKKFRILSKKFSFFKFAKFSFGT